jgi:hypothetical protein
MIKIAIMMKPLFFILLIYVGTTISCQAHSSSAQAQPFSSSLWQSIKDDYQNFYTRDRFTRLGIAFGVGAVMANTHIDQGIRDWYQDQIRTPNSDSVAKTFKKLGDGYYMIPVSLLAMGIGHLSADSEHSVIGEWGQRSFRAYLVGGPANLLAQVLTGASRPQERPDASHWRPFQDANGVSGHTFVGAIPFLTIADMTDNRYVRYGAYFASTFAGWSRINDDAHFASQVFLGWYMAYQATDAVADSEAAAHQQRSHLAILPWPHGVLVAMDYHW